MKYGLGFLPEDAILARVVKVERTKSKATQVEAGLGEGKIIKFAAPNDVEVSLGETIAVIGAPVVASEPDSRHRHPSGRASKRIDANVTIAKARASFKIPGQPSQMLVVTPE